MTSLDPYPLQAHTLLDAVNLCLREIGQGNVLALDADDLTPDAERALKTVHDVSAQEQTLGWAFNTEQALMLDPWPSDGTPAAGTITLPASVLRVIAINPTTGRNLVQRGGRLYDPFTSSFAIGQSVSLKCVIMLDFEDMPQAARAYVAIKAARKFRINTIFTDATATFTELDEKQAYVNLLHWEDDNDDLTWWEKNTSLARRHAHRRFTS